MLIAGVVFPGRLRMYVLPYLGLFGMWLVNYAVCRII